MSSVRSEIARRSLCLGLKLFQPLPLVALQPAILLAPPVICNFRHPYRPNRFRDRPSLRYQHVNLRSFATISSAVCRFLAISSLLNRLKSHTYLRTTSMGADQQHVPFIRSTACLCSLDHSVV